MLAWWLANYLEHWMADQKAMQMAWLWVNMKVALLVALWVAQ